MPSKQVDRGPSLRPLAVGAAESTCKWCAVRICTHVLGGRLWCPCVRRGASRSRSAAASQDPPEQCPEDQETNDSNDDGDGDGDPQVVVVPPVEDFLPAAFLTASVLASACITAGSAVNKVALKNDALVRIVGVLTGN